MATKRDKDIRLFIKTAQGDWDHEFRKEEKVDEVIKAIIDHFKFATDGKYELRPERDPKEVLDPQRTIESYHLKEGEHLIFTDLGGGV